jgi:hypothetical protein
MSRTVRALTWAVPVDYDRLVPALKAYATIKPSIEPILASNKLPQTQECFISKLPQELVDKINAYVMSKELKKQYMKWTKLEACYNGSCNRTDHLSEDEWEQLADEVADEHEVFRDDHDSAIRELVQEKVAWNYEDIVAETHDENVDAYLDLVAAAEEDVDECRFLNQEKAHSPSNLNNVCAFDVSL